MSSQQLSPVKWHNHNQVPVTRQAVIVARKSEDDDFYHLESGIFYLDYSKGRAVPVDEMTKVHKSHWDVFFWAYERDVLAGLES